MKKKGSPKRKMGAARKSKSKGYNPQTGRLTGRAVGGQERLERLAEQYVAEGMTASEARTRAREELRDNEPAPALLSE
jgi:hypothetical protein